MGFEHKGFKKSIKTATQNNREDPDKTKTMFISTLTEEFQQFLSV